MDDFSTKANFCKYKAQLSYRPIRLGALGLKCLNSSL